MGGEMSELLVDEGHVLTGGAGIASRDPVEQGRDGPHAPPAPAPVPPTGDERDVRKARLSAGVLRDARLELTLSFRVPGSASYDQAVAVSPSPQPPAANREPRAASREPRATKVRPTTACAPASLSS